MSELKPTEAEQELILSIRKEVDKRSAKLMARIECINYLMGLAEQGCGGDGVLRKNSPYYIAAEALRNHEFEEPRRRKYDRI